jgi:hypothetical protein
MSFAGAFGANARYGPSQVVGDLARQVFLQDIQESDPADPGRLSNALAGRKDCELRRIDEFRARVNSPVFYFDEVVLLGTLTFGDFPPGKNLTDIDRYVRAARLITILGLGRVCFLVGFRILEPRVREEKHLVFIRSCPCTSTEAALTRIGSITHNKSHTGMDEKPSAKWTLPLCNRHHREQHAFGDELASWAEWGVDPFALAITYQSH